MIDTLLDLGFSKNDAQVYKALVETGPCFVAPLVRETKKHRQIVYNSLNALMEKHLVTSTSKNGKNYYSISDPTRLITEIKQKEIVANSLVNSIQKIQKREDEQVEVFAGSDSYEKGIADFRRHALVTKECLIIRGETKGWFEYSKSFFPKHVEGLKSLKRSGVDIMITFFEYERQLAKDRMGKYLSDPYICKIVPDEYKLPHSAWVTGEHVYILTPAVEPLVIHVKSKTLAKQYREYFWNTWGKGRMLK